MPDLDDSIPRYYLHTQRFMGGKIYEAGSIIGWKGEAADDMEPLNDAARAKAEEFYLKVFEYQVEDPNVPGRMITVKHQPRLKLRPLPPGSPQTEHEVITIRGPVASEQGNKLGLAGLAQRVSTDQRPGPATQTEIPEEFRTKSTPVMEKDSTPPTTDPMDLPPYTPDPELDLGPQTPAPITSRPEVIDEAPTSEIAPLSTASGPTVGVNSKSVIRSTRT